MEDSADRGRGYEARICRKKEIKIALLSICLLSAVAMADQWDACERVTCYQLGNSMTCKSDGITRSCTAKCMTVYVNGGGEPTCGDFSVPDGGFTLGVNDSYEPIW